MRLALASFGAIVLVLGCGGMSIRSGDADSGGADGNGGRNSSGGRSGSSSRTGGVGATGNAGGTVSVPTGGTGGTGGTAGVTVAGTGGTTTGKGGGSTANDGPLDPPGPVFCGGVPCPAPRACCLTNSRCFDPQSEPEICPQPGPDPDHRGTTPCASNAHCGSGEYCSQDGGYLCQGAGFCHSRSNCPSSGFAVCGCDGNSYPNLETACRSGTGASIFHRGACGDTVDANDGEGEPRWITLCGSDAHCPVGLRCCSITSVCYPESDPGQCQMPPEGTRYPCTADDQCVPELEFCAGAGCSGPGGCASIDQQAEKCGVRLEPVCGCNGATYTSAACAWAEGTRVQSEGECPR